MYYVRALIYDFLSWCLYVLVFGGVAKCVGDVAMYVGDHMKVLIFLCSLTRGTAICCKNNL